MTTARKAGEAGETVAVLGLARSGRAAAELALRAGYRVYASDVGDTPALREAAEAVRRAGGEAEVGGHSVEKIAACDLIVVSSIATAPRPRRAAGDRAGASPS